MVVEDEEQDFSFKNVFMCTVHSEHGFCISNFCFLSEIKDYESTQRIWKFRDKHTHTQTA